MPKFQPVFYWALVPFLVFIQILFTSQALSIMTREGLLESVTSVYWFAHNSIYYGAYTNVGWYMVLLLIYKVFGFTLFTAQYYRIFLCFVSLLCLAEILKKYFGIKKSVVPLITIGLSPTLLYYTSLQAVRD